MKYTDKTMMRDEFIIARGQLHWIIYLDPLILLLISIFTISLARDSGEASALVALIGLLLFFVSIAKFIICFIQRRTTELAVTNRRVIVKTGLIRRDTIEINAQKIESVDVQQSILGRLLNFGTVTVRGTGIGMNPMKRVRDPLAIRAAIAEL